ncbi:MAG: hypothetical protein ACNA8W_04425 [Bradymonadaceae bacterium]
MSEWRGRETVATADLGFRTQERIQSDELISECELIETLMRGPRDYEPKPMPEGYELKTHAASYEDEGQEHSSPFPRVFRKNAALNFEPPWACPHTSTMPAPGCLGLGAWTN